jgi:hypothetical protein
MLVTDAGQGLTTVPNRTVYQKGFSFREKRSHCTSKFEWELFDTNQYYRISSSHFQGTFAHTPLCWTTNTPSPPPRTTTTTLVVEYYLRSHYAQIHRANRNNVAIDSIPSGHSSRTSRWRRSRGHSDSSAVSDTNRAFDDPAYLVC